MPRINLFSLLFIIMITPLFSLPCLATSGATETFPPFTPSKLQQNGARISTLENTAKYYVDNKEIDDVNFGLHLVNFDGSILNNPHEQFLTDFARIYCNPKYESKLPECKMSNNDSSPTTYGILRPSYIFKNTYGTLESAMSTAIARTIVDPFPKTKLNEMLKNPEVLQDEEKRLEIANLIAPQASLMLAKNSFNELFARRTPPNQTEPSIMQTIFDESTRRLTDPNWIKSITQLPAQQLLMELLQIEAFKLWVEYNKFTQNERIELLLAAILSKHIAGGAMGAMGDAAQGAKEDQENSEKQSKEAGNLSKDYYKPLE